MEKTNCIYYFSGIGSKGKILDPEKGSYVKADFEKAIELTGK